MTFFRGIGAFIEDLWPGILVGFAFGVALLLALLVLTDAGFNESDCATEVLEARAELAAEILSDVGPMLLAAQIEMDMLRAELAGAQSNGSSAASGIRQNEELGAWSDAAGDFYCFPVEGAGFGSS